MGKSLMIWNLVGHNSLQPVLLAKKEEGICSQDLRHRVIQMKQPSLIPSVMMKRQVRLMMKQMEK